jgi:hypothetical protein
MNRKRVLSIWGWTASSIVNAVLIVISLVEEGSKDGYLLTTLWSAAFLCSIVCLTMSVRNKE